MLIKDTEITENPIIDADEKPKVDKQEIIESSEKNLER